MPPIQVIDNRVYIEPKEITGINYNTVRSNMRRGVFSSIKNPNYTGSNAKTLVLFDSLPFDCRQAILNKAEGDIQYWKDLIEEERSRNTELNIAGFYTEATAQIVESGEQLILEDYKTYIDKNYIKHTKYYQYYNIGFKNIHRYARTCALIEKIWKDFSIYQKNPKYKNAYKRLRRVFVLHISQLLEHDTEIQVRVPKSEYRLTEWLDKVLTAANELTTVYELIKVKNSGNENNQRFTDEQRTIANALYNRGSVPSITKVHEKLIEMGEEKGWWMKNGTYCPISFGTLCLHFNTLKNLAAYGRKGKVKFDNEFKPAISRKPPQFKNEVWTADGSPVDELIYEKGTALQRMNSFRVFDVASHRLIGVSTWIGRGEPEVQVMEALKDAIKTTGILPKVFQCDRGGGYHVLKQFCKDYGIIFLPTSAGLSRGKVAENFIGRFSAILKERPAYSGQNLTARGENSQVSAEQYKVAQQVAQPYEEASHWFKTIGRDKWNDRKIKTINKQPVNKTPNELYAEKECRGIALEPMQKTYLTGHCHEKRLTTAGLEIKNNNMTYTYYPDVFTEEGRDRGATLYLNTPLSNHPTKGKLTLYVEEYGAELAYIFDKPIEEGGVYQDTWKLKDEISYVASLNNDTELLKAYREFQNMVKELAREQKEGDEAVYNSEIEDSSDSIDKKAAGRKKQPKRKILNPLGKEQQQAFMEEEKKTKEETLWLKDRITGEMKEVPLDNEQLTDNNE